MEQNLDLLRVLVKHSKSKICTGITFDATFIRKSKIKFSITQHYKGSLEMNIKATLIFDLKKCEKYFIKNKRPFDISNIKIAIIQFINDKPIVFLKFWSAEKYNKISDYILNNGLLDADKYGFSVNFF